MALPNPDWIIDGDGCSLSRQSFRRLAALLERSAGITLADAKQPMVAARLARRARELGFPDVESYARRLDSFDASEVEFLVDALTTHHTFFFREPEHFTALGGALGEELLGARGPYTDLRCLSVACSTGEEPYSAAMVLDDLAQRLGHQGHLGWLGIDVSVHAVAHARRGIYQVEGAREIPVGFRERYLERSKQRPDLVRIRQELRQRVAFEVGNLLQLQVARPAQLVFCRNVLIYFSQEQRRRAIARLWQAVAPGGCLVLGLTESLRETPADGEVAGRSVYRKRAGGRYG